MRIAARHQTQTRSLIYHNTVNYLEPFTCVRGPRGERARRFFPPPARARGGHTRILPYVFEGIPMRSEYGRMCGRVGPEGSPLRPIKGHQRQSVQVLSDEGSPLRSEGPHQLPCSMLCSYVILEALACTCFHMLVLQSSHQRRGEHLHARAFVDCSPPVGSWPSSHQRRGEHLHAGRPSPPPVGSWLS